MERTSDKITTKSVNDYECMDETEPSLLQFSNYVGDENQRNDITATVV